MALPLQARWLLLSAVLFTACVWTRGQRYHHFITPTPLREQSVLVLGFLGGREPWNQERSSIRQLAIKLREKTLPGVYVETVENRKRRLAVQLVKEAFDRNDDGVLDAAECRTVRLILYGQSFGGAAVVKLARQLQQLAIPVALTVQIDSVGRGDALIPPNVASAANLFQRDGWIIRGEPEIRAQDPSKTRILGNFRYSYQGKKIDLSAVPWHKKIGRVAHARMELDPDVWSKVEELILDAIRSQQPVPC
ncbi:MAG: hypothetical protein AB1898_07185 [Acidobacteriota bacterium]